MLKRTVGGPSPERGFLLPYQRGRGGWSFWHVQPRQFLPGPSGQWQHERGSRARGPGAAVAAIPAGGGPSVRRAAPRATFDLGRLPGGACATRARSGCGNHGRTRAPGQVDVHGRRERARCRVALDGAGTAGHGHDVRGRSQAGQELRHAGDGRRCVAGPAIAVERPPRPTGERDPHAAPRTTWPGRSCPA